MTRLSPLAFTVSFWGGVLLYLVIRGMVSR